MILDLKYDILVDSLQSSCVVTIYLLGDEVVNIFLKITIRFEKELHDLTQESGTILVQARICLRLYKRNVNASCKVKFPSDHAISLSAPSVLSPVKSRELKLPNLQDGRCKALLLRAPLNFL